MYIQTEFILRCMVRQPSGVL